MNKSLTNLERVILLNQYELLEKIDAVNADYYDCLKSVLSNGYTHEYYMLDQNFSEELIDEDQELVWDTLEMYSRLYYSFKQLGNPKDFENKIRFQGFDGNEEVTYFAYCKFVVKDLGRYCELVEISPDDLNSHYPVVCKYQKMLSKWDAWGRPLQFSMDQLAEILT